MHMSLRIYHHPPFFHHSISPLSTRLCEQLPRRCCSGCRIGRFCSHGSVQGCVSTPSTLNYYHLFCVFLFSSFPLLPKADIVSATHCVVVCRAWTKEVESIAKEEEQGRCAVCGSEHVFNRVFESIMAFRQRWKRGWPCPAVAHGPWPMVHGPFTVTCSTALARFLSLVC